MVVFVGVGGEGRHRRKRKGVVEGAIVWYNQESWIREAKLVVEARVPLECRGYRRSSNRGGDLRSIEVIPWNGESFLSSIKAVE
jgi:hypothetical protein